MIGGTMETAASFEARFRAMVLPGQLKTDARSNAGQGIDDKSRHPELCSEVADGVTRIIVCLFREPDAGNLPVRFDERVVSRRREIVVLYER